ncbi:MULTISPECIES: LysR family transcriptional regulator [Oceanisphaera]|uniref:LysR family transcriptional regulator n=1 Tax=Oceanisphaera ostreae TaxID=914151 RepID=A0ABW3KI41_9GAMM
MELLQRRLVQFLAVVEQGNIHAAAKQLHVAQPALSRAMKALEEELGLQLLVRQPRGVVPTAAGLVLVDYAHRAARILQQGVSMARDCALRKSGKLLIGYGIFASMSCMPDLIVGFRKAYPDIDVHLRLLATNEQLEALDKGSINLGFAFSIACKQPLESWRISREKPMVLVNKGHPWFSRNRLKVEELADEPMILGNIQRWGYYREIINAICLSAGFSPRVAAEADELPDMMAHLRMGEGIGIMGEGILDQLPPSIKAIPLSNHRLTFDLSMVWNPESPDDISLLFIEYIKSQTLG